MERWNRFYWGCDQCCHSVVLSFLVRVSEDFACVDALTGLIRKQMLTMVVARCETVDDCLASSLSDKIAKLETKLETTTADLQGQITSLQNHLAVPLLQQMCKDYFVHLKRHEKGLFIHSLDQDIPQPFNSDSRSCCRYLQNAQSTCASSRDSGGDGWLHSSDPTPPLQERRCCPPFDERHFAIGK